MSQVGNALNMLILLKSRGKMKAKELADILEVKERTIRRYKEDLMCKFSNSSSTCFCFIEQAYIRLEVARLLTRRGTPFDAE